MISLFHGRCYRPLLVLAAVLLLRVPPLIAVPPATTTNPIDDIAPLLASHQGPRIQAGLALMQERLRTDPAPTLILLRDRWLELLNSASQYQEAADIAQAATLLPVAAADSKTLERLQRARVVALLRAGRPSDAAGAAKVLYNIATMPATADAIILMAESVAAAHPEDPGIADRFRAEQVFGAEAPSATQPARADLPTMNSVQIDGRAYYEAAKDMGEGNYGEMVAKGNLFLMAGFVADARACFEKAYVAAPQRELPAATENLARCMKAEDGCIGRANAWILSIRPGAAAPPTSAPARAGAGSH